MSKSESKGRPEQGQTTSNQEMEHIQLPPGSPPYLKVSNDTLYVHTYFAPWKCAKTTQSEANAPASVRVR